MANKMLEKQEELQLIKVVQEGTAPEYAQKDAMYRIYIAQKNLIISIARHYANDNIELEDLISCGYIGLEKAVKKYDSSKGAKLATHAYMWIRNEIERSLPELGWVIQTPYNTKQDYAYLELLSDNYVSEHGYKPNAQQLAELAHWKVKKVVKTLQYGRGVSSIDHIIDNNANRQTSIADLISDDSNMEKELIHQEQVVELHGWLKKLLPTRTYEIIMLQYFNKMKIADIAKKYSISVARVKQILKQAKTILSTNKDFKEFCFNWEN